MPGTERSTEAAAPRFVVNQGRMRRTDGSAGVNPADAAGRPDVVALAGALQVRSGRPAGTFTPAWPEQADERVTQVRAVRAEAGLTPAELDVLLQQVVIDSDPERVAAKFSAQSGAASGRPLPEVIEAVHP
jgi:hypothetical protein